MAPITEFNERRAARAKDCDFELGPYTMSRQASVAPELIMDFRSGVEEAGGEDVGSLEVLERTIKALCHPDAKVTATGERVSFEDAWRFMRVTGDEFGPLDLQDLSALVQWLVSGVVQRPTGQPSDSPDGSTIPPTGTTSTVLSPSEEPLSLASMPAAR